MSFNSTLRKGRERGGPLDTLRRKPLIQEPLLTIRCALCRNWVAMDHVLAKRQNALAWWAEVHGYTLGTLTLFADAGFGWASFASVRPIA